MSTTVRLDKELEAALSEAARREGVSKSMIIKKSIAAYVAKSRGTKSSFELGAADFDKFGSGDSDRGTNRKSYLKAILRAKMSR